MNKEKRSFIGHLAAWLTWPRFTFSLVLLFFLTGILFPFYWMVSSSFKSYAEIGGREPVYIPGALRLDAYKELFSPEHDSYQNFGQNILNTLQVAIPTTVIAVILSTLGAYAIARLKFKGKEALLNSILMIYLFPGVLLIIPLFAMLAQAGDKLGFNVQDNLGVLIFTYLAQTLPVALYMLTNYFRTPHYPGRDRAGWIDRRVQSLRDYLAHHATPGYSRSCFRQHLYLYDCVE